LKILDAHTHRLEKSSVVSVNLNIPIKEDLVDFFSQGIHPWSLKKDNLLSNFINVVKKIKNNKKLVAIGETGLDKNTPNFSNQKLLFMAHVDMAIRLNLPLIVHCVNAQNEILSILKSMDYQNNLMIHGFNGSRQEALELISRGYSLGIGPQVFSNMKINKYLHQLSLDNLLLETDDSDLSKITIVNKLSEIFNISKEGLVDKLNRNFNLFFGIQSN
jgi:TatD DNase family protein